MSKSDDCIALPPTRLGPGIVEYHICSKIAQSVAHRIGMHNPSPTQIIIGTFILQEEPWLHAEHSHAWPQAATPNSGSDPVPLSTHRSTEHSHLSVQRSALLSQPSVYVWTQYTMRVYLRQLPMYPTIHIPLQYTLRYLQQS